MSLGENGRDVRCDGQNCQATNVIPIALHPAQSPASETLPVAEGWLYVLKQEVALHFCPSCARRYLTRQDENRAEKALQIPGGHARGVLRSGG